MFRTHLQTTALFVLCCCIAALPVWFAVNAAAMPVSDAPVRAGESFYDHNSTAAVSFAEDAAAGEEKNPRFTPVVRAVRKVAPAVVNITTQRVVERSVSPFGGLFADEFFREFSGRGGTRQQVQQSLGSGVIIDGKQHLVLTNAHVIEGATAIQVLLQDGRSFEAELVGSDPDFDLAVLRLSDAQDLPEAPMADSADLMPGETVIAIGNPFGFGHTVTTGVISALNRSVKTDHGMFTDFIQTDAAINPGNSGGPLINIMGELIGLNTAIYAKAEGIGFAIPISKARRAVAELLDRGSVTPVWLGLFGQNMDPRTAAWLRVKRLEGMLITEVLDGSSAQRAGLRPGDVLVALNGHSVEDKDRYLQLLRNHTQGEMLQLDLVREGAPLQRELRAEAFPPGRIRAMAEQRWGFSAVPGRSGLTVQRVRKNGPAFQLGLQPGDVIVKIGGLHMETEDSFLYAFTRHRMDGTLLMLVAREGKGYYVRMKVQ